MIWHHNLSPFLFQFPNGFGIRWYGLSYVFGFVLAYLALKKAIEKNKVPGLTEKNLDSLIFMVILGVLVGGRLGYVLQNMDRWAADPLFPIKLQEGGMAFFGGLGGVIIALFIFSRKHKIPFSPLGDQLTIVTAIALGLGRIANFMNGELFGKPTDGTWGVVFPAGGPVPRHPSQIYDMVSHFALALILWFISRTEWGKKSGSLWTSFVIGYGIFRFITEIFRDGSTPVGPLVAGQVASLVIIAIGCVGLYVMKGQRQAPAQAA